MNPQPNFETLKKSFYQAFYNSTIVDAKIMMQSIRGDFRSYHKKRDEFLKDFNKWLDGIDIRQSGTLIDVLIEHKKDVAGWLKKKQYCIDYNNHGALDLIRL